MCHSIEALPVRIFLFFPAQIRKKVVPDLLPHLRRAAAQKHNMCHSVSCFLSNMLCYPPTRDRPRTTGKGRVWLFRVRGTLPES